MVVFVGESVSVETGASVEVVFVGASVGASVAFAFGVAVGASVVFAFGAAVGICVAFAFGAAVGI